MIEVERWTAGAGLFALVLLGGCPAAAPTWAPEDPLFPEIARGLAGCEVEEVDSSGTTYTHSHDRLGRATLLAHDMPALEYASTIHQTWAGGCAVEVVMRDEVEGQDGPIVKAQTVVQRCDRHDQLTSVEVTESWAAAGIVAEFDNHYDGGELIRVDRRSDGGDVVTSSSVLTWADGRLVKRVDEDDSGRIEVLTWSWEGEHLVGTTWEEAETTGGSVARGCRTCGTTGTEAALYQVDHLWDGDRWVGYDASDAGGLLETSRFVYDDAVHGGRLPLALQRTPAGADAPDWTVEYTYACDD